MHFINNRETPVRLKKGQVLGALGNTYTVNPGLVAATDSTTDNPASPPSSQGKPVDSVAQLAQFDLTPDQRSCLLALLERKNEAFALNPKSPAPTNKVTHLLRRHE